MIDQTRIEEIKLRQLFGESSPEEDAELEAWARESPENRRFLETRMSPAAFQQDLLELRRFDHKRIDKLTKERLGNHPGMLDWIPERGHGRITYIGAGIAAVVQLLFGRKKNL